MYSLGVGTGDTCTHGETGLLINTTLSCVYRKSHCLGYGMVHYHSFRRLSHGEKLTFQDIEKFSDSDNQNEIMDHGSDHRLNEGDRERRPGTYEAESSQATQRKPN